MTIDELAARIAADRRMAEIVRLRPRGMWGIAVQRDPLALEWQALECGAGERRQDIIDAAPALLECARIVREITQRERFDAIGEDLLTRAEAAMEHLGMPPAPTSTTDRLPFPDYLKGG